MKEVKAKLRWLTPAEGGRTRPPGGETYSTVATFEQNRRDPHCGAWSLVVRFIEPPDEKLSHYVMVRFLVDWAPEEWLESGNSFELLEGAKVVAVGQVC